jgi:hypothetical protein
MSTTRPPRHPLDTPLEPPTGRHHAVLASTVGPSAATNAAPRLAPGRYLAIDNGDDVAVVVLRGDQMTLGRSLDANVCFEDVSVSRRHARVFVADDVTLIDERSLNGVWVNGKRVTRRILHNEDSIALGSVRLRYIEIPDAGISGAD